MVCSVFPSAAACILAWVAFSPATLYNIIFYNFLYKKLKCERISNEIVDCEFIFSPTILAASNWSSNCWVKTSVTPLAELYFCRARNISIFCSSNASFSSSVKPNTKSMFYFSSRTQSLHNEFQSLTDQIGPHNVFQLLENFKFNSN